MPFTESKNHIFINYSRADSTFVDELYNFLFEEGYHPWMDRKDILPGDKWERAIDRAIKNSAVFIAVLSKNSFERRGVLQQEIVTAIEKSRRMMPFDIYIIPVRLDECDIPERLEDCQVIDWDGDHKKYLLI